MATSNRKHRLPEHMSGNLEARLDAEVVLRPAETTEEKMSWSDWFGLVLAFLASDQLTHLRIVDCHAEQLRLMEELPAQANPQGLTTLRARPRDVKQGDGPSSVHRNSTKRGL